MLWWKIHTLGRSHSRQKKCHLLWGIFLCLQQECCQLNSDFPCFHPDNLLFALSLWSYSFFKSVRVRNFSRNVREQVIMMHTYQFCADNVRKYICRWEEDPIPIVSPGSISLRKACGRYEKYLLNLCLSKILFRLLFCPIFFLHHAFMYLFKCM